MKKILALIFSIILLVSCSSPEQDPSYWHGDGDKKVAFIGDSITFLAASQIEQKAQAKNLRTHVDSTIGIDVRNSQAAIEKADANNPDAVVINLGTNDAGRFLNVDAVKANYAAYVTRFSRKCVILVTLSNKIPNQEFVQNINSVMREAERVRTSLGNQDIHLADWEEQVKLHPEWVPDGVHPENEGVDGYSSFIVNSLEKCASLVQK